MTHPKPLSGRTIVITRSRTQSAEFREKLEAAGANVIELPAIEIRPRFSPELDEAVNNLETYDWLILTSVNGVVIFFDQVLRLRPDLAKLGFHPPRICAIGPATAQKIEDFGHIVGLLPSVYQAEGILTEFTKINGGDLHDLKILLPRAAKAREILPAELRKQGAKVEVIPIYDTVIPEKSRSSVSKALARRPDLICFTSSSTVDHFVQMADAHVSDLRSLNCAAIGPITAATARDHGLKVEVQPSDWTVPALVEAIVEYFGEKQEQKSTN